MSEFLGNKTGVSIVAILFASFLFSALCPVFLATDVFAYTASLSTSGTVTTNVTPNTEGDKSIDINQDSVNVITDCRAGYNLTISSSVTDRNLYKDGNSSNNTSGQYFTPVDGTSQLSNTTNQYGYSLTANTESGVFTPLPLPSAPTFLRTPSQTASETDIDDDISVYYGVSTSNTLAPGLYKMPNSGYILYQLTLDESCVGYTVEFNPNGGTGTMNSQSVPLDTASNLMGNSFTAPTMGQSYQNAAGTTIPATAGKMWAFWGWNTAIDGSGDWYKDRESVTNLANDGDTITFYAQWKQATLADLTTSTPGQNKTIDHNTMQDMSAATCWNSDKFTAIGTPYGQATLIDTRDGNTRTYTVARLPDGYCWMTQNLNLGTSTPITLTSNDTDLAEGTTFTLPASDPTDFSTTGSEANYNKATVLNDMIIPNYTVNGTTYSGKVTGYYSYAAATADTNTYSKSSATEVTTSICPKNWDLPTTTQYYDLRTKGSIETYNNTAASYVGKNAGNEPYYFVYGGYRKAAGSVVNSTYFTNPTSYGYFWTANNYSSPSGRNTYVYSSGLYDNSTGSTNTKYYGLGIRCVSNMDGVQIKITFVNTDTGETQTQIVSVVGESNTITLQQHPATWTKTGYSITGWDTSSAGANVVYSRRQSVTLSSDITLYTVWKPAYTVQYDGNGADAGVMTNMKHINVGEGDIFDLFASNYSRAGYGFAGWSFDRNAQPGGTSRIYGPNETITAPAGTLGETKTLYAIWVASTGNIQDWKGCSNMSVGDVTALKDTRDDQVYTVGKLADDNCWTMENLRLNTAGSSDSTKAQGFGGVFVGLANPENSNTFPAGTGANSLYTTDTTSTTLNIVSGDNLNYRIPRYENKNISDRSADPSVTDDRINATSSHDFYTNSRIYSYGNYYNWAAVMANTENLVTSTVSEAANTSICPSGWKLPYGDSYGKGNASGGFYYLGTQIGATASNEASSRIWRSYPQNFTKSGGTHGGIGYSARYYTSTSYGAYLAYALQFSATYVDPGTYNGNTYTENKSRGYAIRCVLASGLEVKLMLNDGTGRVGGRVYGEANSIVALPTNLTRKGYRFASWNTAANGSGTSYTNSYTLGSTGVTLYAQWTPTYTLQYDGNGADAGVMTNVKHTNIQEGDVFDLFASNYSKAGYGFAGWSFDPNAQPGGASRIYGPNEAITAPAPTTPGETKTLYAVWVQSAGNLQDWNGCASMSIGDVTALKDTRDNQVYTVGKLADDNCWMMENLRLDTAGSSDSTKSQGFGGVFVGLADPESANFSNSTTANTLNGNTLYSTANITDSNQGYRFPRYNNSNTGARATSPSVDDDRSTVTSAHNTGLSTATYSYGNYYTWAAAMANTENLTTTATSDVAGTSICPKGWKLPYGNSSGNGNTSGGFYYLGTQLGATTSNETSSRIWRGYPNNYVYPGYFYSSSVGTGSRGNNGYYWSSSGGSSSNASLFHLTTSTLSPGQTSTYKYRGHSVRCVAGKTNISQLTYMQDFKNLTSSEKTAVINSMSMGTEYTLIDSRDNETYVIAKLGDGKVWMEDNLRLGNTSSMALTTANTNSIGNFTLPAGTTSGYSETSPYINVSSKNTIATTKWGDGSGKVGVYYNYCAASAGTICSSSNSSDASYDICPAGWRMPTGHTNGEFQALRDAYSDVGNFQREASMLLSGYVKSGTISNYNEFGTAWSSTLGDSTTMHNMIVYSSSFSSTDATQRYNMNPIRCIVK